MVQKCKMVARVLFDYDAQDEGELSIREGGMLLITDDTDQDWWEAHERPLDTFEEGRKGLVPLTYVEEVFSILTHPRPFLFVWLQHYTIMSLKRRKRCKLRRETLSGYMRRQILIGGSESLIIALV